MPTRTAPIRVLMLDDDEEDYLLISDHISEADKSAHCRHISSYDRDRAELWAGEFDVLLLDYQLGGIDGLTVIKELMEGGFAKPIILMTGQDDYELGRQAVMMGATDYLVKGTVSGETISRACRYSIERFRMQNQLKAFANELEERVRQRTAELELATRELQGFTYTASHDLRTPLRAIMGTSKMLIEDYGESLPPEAKVLLDRQAKAARRLGDLLDDLLELSRLGSHSVRTVKVRLKDIFDLVAPDSAPGWHMDVDPQLTVQADPKLLRLVVQNIVENSVKFALPNGEKRIEVRGLDTPQGPAIRIRDFGKGFDQRYEPKIWEPFQRLVRDDDVPGTGIGLANVKRIIERHGGTIWAESAVGQGVSFFMRLPESQG